MKKLRVSLLLHEDLIPPDTIDGLTDAQIAPWKTEYDVFTALDDLGHDVQPLGVSDDLAVIRDALTETKPHIVFNLLEEFHDLATYVPYVLGYLELLRQPYTGCNPEGMMLTRNKALAKKILRHHLVRMPDFAVFPRKKTVKRPKHLEFPLFVKSMTEHGSVGISQASIVHDDEKLRDRVEFVHDQLGTDALAEQYIEGRELYVGVIGNRRLDTFPIWELRFKNLPENVPRIATEKVKWDARYQKRAGVRTRAAADLSPDLTRRIQRLCKRVYRILGQSGYARMDLRLTADERVYLLESNPNPQLEYGEDFAESAATVGFDYVTLIQRILNLGRRYQAEWKR